MLKLVIVAVVLAVAHADFIGNEIGSLDFGQIIGGPLQAVVKAQGQAAHTTANFIESVGFVPSDPEDLNSALKLVTVAFNYNTTINNTVVERSMSVPFLYMVPIPFLQFDSVTVDFSVKISSVSQRQYQYSRNATASGQFSAGFSGSNFQAGVTFNGGVSVQQNTEASTKITRDYSLQVNVRGSQAAMPGGMNRVLDLFEAIIQQDAPKVS